MFCYGVGNVEGVTFQTHWDVLQSFGRWGFRINPHIAQCHGIDAALAY